ncbi:per-hexamer repeat gene 4 [Mus musculus]|uniref:Putative per-hexamer repeat protein 4 n=2 Tax=Mus musculus TaxID=10090 RepID=PHXR4_MOUSE|nr:RecName: Full=Putative per-hexamer repeat protein 4 [Mus musculus]AAI07289.1 Per-hexamer repeat gene 4 [Mus musculus]AAI07290.1 Per-hexamer repeat gene 4 [Mus musculus]AAI27148.1 Phxr4 protein [Mus musculus]EDL24973.1 per-hexamer repeat gene 4 [Mus musculus]CAB42649.1 unnamed protein product [Mus musculus]
MLCIYVCGVCLCVCFSVCMCVHVLCVYVHVCTYAHIWTTALHLRCLLPKSFSTLLFKAGFGIDTCVIPSFSMGMLVVFMASMLPTEPPPSPWVAH